MLHVTAGSAGGRVTARVARIAEARFSRVAESRGAAPRLGATRPTLAVIEPVPSSGESNPLCH
jgi:hypothetical protein